MLQQQYYLQDLRGRVHSSTHGHLPQRQRQLRRLRLP